MYEDLQIANNIIKKEFGKRRCKIVNSTDKIKHKCVMIEISDCNSPSIVFYYNKKNEENVEKPLETYHSGNQFSFSRNNDISRIDLFLYCIGEGESNESTFQLSE